VVFDDKFETVFHYGKTTEELDKICDGLFADCRDCYAEEEYDEDGILFTRRLRWMKYGSLNLSGVKGARSLRNSVLELPAFVMWRRARLRVA
jgi:hypothetical protein